MFVWVEGDSLGIIAAADGSALGNPGPAGWAWYINDQQWKSGGWEHATNNQAELMAVLSLLTETQHSREHITILCDSKYVIDSLTKWLPGWKRRGWRKADGKPVLNRELFESLDAALTGRNVRFEWVKGHSGHPMNEKVDELARKTATAYQRGTPPASGPGFTVDASLEENNLNASHPNRVRTVDRVTDPLPLFADEHDALFSESTGTSSEAQHADTLATVTILEQRSLDLVSGADISLAQPFLHPAFREVIHNQGSDYHHTSRELSTFIPDRKVTTLEATLVSPEMVILTSTSINASPGPLWTSVWLKISDSWLLVHRHISAS